LYYIEIHNDKVYHAQFEYASGFYALHNGNTHTSDRTYIHSKKLFNTAYLKEVLAHCKAGPYQTHVVIPSSIIEFELVQILIILEQSGITPYTISTTPLQLGKKYSYYWLLTETNKLPQKPTLKQIHILLCAMIFLLFCCALSTRYKNQILIDIEHQEQQAEAVQMKHYKQNERNILLLEKKSLIQKHNTHIADILSSLLANCSQPCIIHSLQFENKQCSCILLTQKEIEKKALRRSVHNKYSIEVSTIKLPEAFAPYTIKSKIAIAPAKSTNQ